MLQLTSQCKVYHFKKRAKYNISLLKKISPVLLLTLVNTLGFSILIPVLPFVVRKSGYSDFIYGFLISAYSASQFFGSLILGSLSDIHGRKPLLLISQAGTLLSWFVFATAWVIGEQYQWVPLSLFIIAIARVTDGITGGNTTVANAYLSDVLPPEKRGIAFGYVGAVVGLGIIIGPAIGAFTSTSKIGYLGMVIFSIVLSTITLITIAIMLKESLPAERRNKYQQEQVSKNEYDKKNQLSFFIAKILKNLNIFNSLKIFKKNKVVMSVFVVKLFISVVLAANSTTIVLLIIDRFSFNQKEVGFFLLVVGGFFMLNQIFLVKKFIERFGELFTLFLALVFIGVGLFLFPVLESLILFVVFYYLTNLGFSLSFPTIRAIASREAPKKLQGKVMGIDESIFSISMAIIPFISAALYNWIAWKSFLVWGTVSIIGAIYFISKNFSHIDSTKTKNQN